MTRYLAVLGKIAVALLGLAAVGLLVLSPAIGSIGSIVAIVAIVLASPAAIPAANRPTAASRSAPAVLLTVFVALGFCLVVEVMLHFVIPGTASIEMIEINFVLLLIGPLAALYFGWPVIRQQPAMVMFVAIFASLVVCYAATADQWQDVLFASNFFALLLAPIVYLLASGRPGGRTIAIVAALLLLGALVGALTGSFDVFVLHRERAVGWGQGGNLMARTVVLLGFMALSGVFVLSSRWRWLYLLGPVLALYTLYLTGTRGVFIAIPLLGLIVVWALMRELRAPRIWYAVGAALVVVAIGIVGVLSPRFLGLGSVLEQVTSGSNVSDAATSERLYMWEAGLHTFLKSPLIGSGWANFTEAAKPYGIYMFHNDLLDMAVAAGIVGIVGWIATIAAPLVGVFVMPRDRFASLRLYCALILSTSLLLFGLTDMTLGYDLPTTLHAFLTAIVLGAFREPEPRAA